MNSEAIIRKEVRDFLEFRISDTLERYKTAKAFIELIKNEINDLYSTESKMIYLDEVNAVVKEKLDDHNQNCSIGNQCKTYSKFEAILFYLKQEIDFLPKVIKSQHSKISNNRNKVFISYSHIDKEWLYLLKRHFRPLENRIDFWDDSKIKPGQKWKEEIESALSNTKIGILLISADFFNSEFIINNELPPLLESAENDGATILSIILKPCMFDEYPEIACYQAINSPSNTIIQMNEGERELTFVELVKQIKEIIEKNG